MINENLINNFFNAFIKSIGDNPKRDGLIDTPSRVIKSYAEIFNGYGKDPNKIIKTLDSDYKGLIVFKDVKFYSICEHHLLPFFGTVDIGILPSKKTNKVIGFNKIFRLVDIYAHRLQIQENLTKEITDCIERLLKPEGVILITKARHLCAEMRSIKHEGHHITCIDYRGEFLKKNVRENFISNIKI